jgi:aspartate aminotransferase
MYHLDVPLAIVPRPSATIEANRVRQERLKNNQVVYNWGLGANPLPAPKIIREAIYKHAHQKDYYSPSGIEPLAKVIANRESIANYKISFHNVIIAPGLKQLLQDVQVVFGGPVVHIVPHWVSYSEQTNIYKISTFQIHTKKENNFQLEPKDIHDFIKNNSSLRNKTKLIILNHPTNPTGLSYSDSQLLELAVAFKQYNFIVFSDEVYLGNTHNMQKHSIAKYLPTQTIRASSLSKEFGLGGYRLGWAVFPDSLSSLKEAMYAVGTSSYTCASIPIQYAALSALEYGPQIKEFLKSGQKIFSAAAGYLFKEFSRLGISFYKPDSAWYFFLDFSKYRKRLSDKGIFNSQDLNESLAREKGLIFVPGVAFGMPKDNLYLRASFIDFNPEDALLWARNKSMQQNNENFDAHSAPKWLNKMLGSIKVLEDYLYSLED